MTTPSPSPLSPHPHAAVIKAWADGHAVEWRPKEYQGRWTPLTGSNPGFFIENDYRLVKPADPPVLTPRREDDLRRLLLETEILHLRAALTGAREMERQAQSINSSLRHDWTHYTQLANDFAVMISKLQRHL